ncbi:cytochrome b-c1 complex subunit 8-like [Castanea sativa]|uniref:cytochrome b-c1 complex subunit 8-like n=1 Tax=Castanea sativa TaxID=21020 RepID=UPI003F64CEBE
MGKQPVRMKAVVYALSPFQKKVMPGLWKDIPGKIHHKVSENWHSAVLLLALLVDTYSFLVCIVVLLLAFGVDHGTGTMDEGLRFLVSSF